MSREKPHAPLFAVQMNPHSPLPIVFHGIRLGRDKSPAPGATWFEDVPRCLSIIVLWIIIYYYNGLSQEKQLQKCDTKLKASVPNPIFRPIFFKSKRHEITILDSLCWQCRASYPNERKHTCLISNRSPGIRLLPNPKRCSWVEKMFSHLQKDSNARNTNPRHVFCLFLRWRLGKFPPTSSRPLGWVFATLGEGWKWSPKSPQAMGARCEISHGRTSESCGVPGRKGDGKDEEGGEEEKKQPPERKKIPKAAT